VVVLVRVKFIFDFHSDVVENLCINEPVVHFPTEINIPFLSKH